MLRFIDLAQANVREARLTPALLKPVIEAVRNRVDFMPVVRQAVGGLGFDSFLCGFSTSPRPDREAQLYVFSTLPPEWAALYDRNAYIEVDPRVQLTFHQMGMMIWSAEEFRGRGARLDRFLDDAARFGVRSGACFTTHDTHNHGVMCAFNSAQPRLTERERAQVEARVGEMHAFGTYFHEILMREVIERGLPSRMRGATISPREVEVLKMVSRGLTAVEIGEKLGITERTVRFHADAARTKMGAATREEAIALAVKAGLFEVLP